MMIQCIYQQNALRQRPCHSYARSFSGAFEEFVRAALFTVALNQHHFALD